MRGIRLMALLFAFVAGLIVVGTIGAMQTDLAALTSGGVQAIVNVLASFWFLVVVVVGMFLLVSAMIYVFASTSGR